MPAALGKSACGSPSSLCTPAGRRSAMADEFPDFLQRMRAQAASAAYNEADIAAAREEVERIDAELAGATIHQLPPRASNRGNGKLLLRPASLRKADEI